MDISCTGITGHGSLVPDGTAAGKIRYIIDKFLDYRESEKIKLLENPNLTLGDVTTVNLMALEVCTYTLSIYQTYITYQLFQIKCLLTKFVNFK